MNYYIGVKLIKWTKKGGVSNVRMTLVYVNHLVESGKGYLWDDLMKVTKLFIEANQEQNS